ncbi:MAG: type I-E CRISPR-associated protein Cse2/CasB [Desulfovibrio sp.]|nr:type I-E CRISPR-associated protein Cse2/CasB [Desulfovibrio sp.]
MTLLDFLLKNKDNRGVLAALRKALAPTTETRAWPYLARFDGIGQNPKARAVRTVAGLFALHPENCSDGNMGDTCRALCRDTDEHPWETVDAVGRAVTPGTVSRKFGWLLAADPEEICDRVTRVVRYAKSKGIPVNYAQLEKDLANWPYAREAWARNFWAVEKADSAGEEGAS